jgi:CRP-like cAMP-binding protein
MALSERWSAGRIEALLMRGSWFAALPPSLARQMLASGQIRHYGKADVICCANQPTGIWAVLQGSVALSRISAAGKEFVFYVARPGCWLGVYGVVTGRVLDIVATASGETTMLTVPRPEAKRIVAADPAYQFAMAQLSMDRFVHVLDALEQTSRLTPAGRVAAKLIGIRAMDLTSDPMAGDLPLAISQSALALMTSLSRQSVSGALRDLARAGAIAVGFKEIAILDLDRLQAIADEAG